MESAHNPPKGRLEGVEADGRLYLPPNVTTIMAENLRAGLVLAADHEESITIDASETESIGQAALQLLIAAKMEADRLSMPFAIEHVSPRLAARLAGLGMADILELPVEEGQGQ